MVGTAAYAILIKRILAYFLLSALISNKQRNFLSNPVLYNKNMLRLSLSEIVMAHAIRRKVA
jgi:hypothetical protein